ncbi:uncharacterized protein LOC119109927 [Pollicipes pollicipes]|uniref:uncharacterized protein LOC119109927 n=1 Tax=Pollicipes pollicipes TaxID=41117 RepID=UPI00188504E2|nr:uncharacterized protein LOC119109927 [Pollicipes pollicipes]
MTMTMAAANMLPNNSMNFTENQHGNAILEMLRHQREQNYFCDVILHVQGQQFEAHRNVLASCSKYFQNTFKQDKVVKEQLTISCGGHEIFRCLLDYIYTGNVVIDKNNVSELVRLSNHFSVLKLRGHCSEYLERYLDVTNCLSVMDMADRYQMTELLRTAVTFVKANIDDVLRQQEAMELPQAKVEQLVIGKELALSPERQLTFVLNWVRHSVSSRENELRQLLVGVPLQLVERGRLLQLVQTDRLLAESERCLYFTLQSLSDAGVRLPAYEQLFSQMEEKYMQDLVVDNDTFLSMAISTAIEELEGTEATIFDGLHRLQQQAAVSSSQNPPPIETFSISAIDDALGGVELTGGEQETARDLRCHAGEPRYLGRYQEPPPPPPPPAAASRYTDYGDALGAEQAPHPPQLHDKYEELQVDEQHRYGGGPAADHQRIAPRQNARYRGAADCHEMAGLYQSLESRTFQAAPDARLRPLCASYEVVDEGRPAGREQAKRKLDPGLAEELRSGAAEPGPDIQPTVHRSPKKKRLRQRQEPPVEEDEPRPEHTGDRFARALSGRRQMAPCSRGAQLPPPPPPRHFVCPRCPAVFTVQAALEKHRAEKHRPGPLKKTFTCDICQMCSEKTSIYFKHMRTHFDGPPFTCSICFREYPVFLKFMRHRREHAENKPHRCPDCNLSFWKKGNLSSHMRIHTGERPFKCEECGAVFALSTTLRQHMSSHATEKKHVCDECNFSTKYANHLVAHKKIHAGDLHRCQHAGCSYTTPKRSHLREHLQAHAKRRNHHCPHCHRAFNVKTHLSRHLRTHDETKLYRCHLCDYSVHRSDRLKSHMARHAHSATKGRRVKAKKPPDAEPATVAPLATDWGVF